MSRTSSQIDAAQQPAGSVRNQCWGLVFALAVVLLPTGARAEGDSFFKKIQWHPHLGFAAQYDDNLFLSPSAKGRQADFSFVVSPGLQLFYGDKDRNYIGLDYTLGLERFVRLTDQDAENHYLTFDTHVEVKHLTLDLAHVFQVITGPNVDVGTRVRQRQNISHAEAEYRISEKTAAGLNYRQEFHEFTSTNLTNYSLFEVGGSFFYKLRPKTDLFVQFNQGWVREDNNGDEDYQEANLGLRGKLTSKIIGTIKGGYQHRHFESGASDANIASASASLEAKFTERTSAELLINRTINPSASSAGNSYEITRVGLTVRQKLGRKFTLSANGAYEHDDYDQPIGGVNRQDDYWETGCGLHYDMTKYLQMGVRYQFARNGTTLPSAGFEHNIVALEALLHF